MKYFQFKTFTTSYYFPKSINDFRYMYGLYSAYGGMLSKIYWWLFRHSSIVRLVSVLDESNLPFPYNRIKKLDGSDCVMSFNMGSPGVEQKISILGYDLNSNIPFFSKFSEKLVARELTKNEIKVYQLLSNSGLTPKLLNSIEADDAVYMKVEYVEGKRPNNTMFTEDIVSLALTLSSYHLSEIHESPNGLKMSLSHGDFCPWNILVKDNSFRLIDWELAKDRTLGFDLFTYICQVSALLGHGESMLEAIKKEKNLLMKYFGAFDIKDYLPYLKAFVEEKYQYEKNKKGSSIVDKYKELMISISCIQTLWEFMEIKPKILFIMHMPPPMHGAAQMGQYIHDSKLINDSFECRYINPSASENVNEVGRLRLKKIKFMFYFLGHIRKTLDEFQPDLVYLTPSSWDWGFYRDYITVTLLKSKGCRIVSHFHNKGVKKFEDRWFNKLLYRSFFKDLYVIFLSNKLSPEFKDYIEKDKLFICPNGIKSNCESFVNHTVDNSKPFHFLFLSNMMEEKGVYVLLDACKILKEKNYNFFCTFVGKWSDVTKLNFVQKVTENGLDNLVSAVGAKYDKEKIDYYQNSHCFVFPTYYHGECFPLVLLEAMSYGLPCISTPEGGILDIIDDGINGFIVNQKDSFSLSQKMECLLTNKSLVDNMSTQATDKFYTEYTYEIFENNMYSILSKCLSNV